jgi:CHAT domain-containing protein/predicted negative regulator of RcsB-dependent stress response
MPLLTFNLIAHAIGLSSAAAQLAAPKKGDVDLAAAEKVFSEADRMRLEWKLQSLQKAIKKYEEALSYWRKTNKKEKELITLERIGDICLILSRNQQALNYYNQALDISRAASNRKLEIDLLNSIGFAYFDLNNKQATLEYCDNARAMSQAIGYKRGEAQALNHLGIYYGDDSNFTEAVNALNRACVLWESIQDITGLAEALINTGNVYGDKRETRAAIQHFEKALQLYRKANNRRGESQALIGLGVSYVSLGETQKSFDAHNEAMQIARSLGDRRSEAISLNGVGYVYETMRDEQKALDSYSAALQIHIEQGSRDSEAITLGNIGRIYALMGDKQKALDYYNQKLGIINDDRMKAYTFNDIGAIFGSSGDKDKALDYYNHALSLASVASDPRAQGYILNNIGRLYDSRGDRSKALTCYTESLALMRATDDGWGEALPLRNIALLKRDAGDLADAYNEVKSLIGLVETLRARVISDDLRSTYFASARENYELYIDILMRLRKKNPSAGYDAAALEASESARARSLLDLLAEAHADIRQGVDPKLLENETSLRESLNIAAQRQTNILSRKHTAEQALASSRQVQTLEDQHEQALTQIKAGSPRYAAMIKANPLNTAEIQKLLDANTLLLEYSLGDEKSYLWAVTQNSISSFELPGRAEIEAAAKSLYKSITSRNLRKIGETPQQLRSRLQESDAQYTSWSSKLSEILLDPVSSILGAKQLVIVADGALQYIPFQALPDPNSSNYNEGWKPLLIDHELINLPSVSALALLRREIEERKSPAKAVAALADPVFETDDIRVIRKGRNGRNQKRWSANSDKTVSPKQELMRSAVEAGIAGEDLRLQRLPSAGREAREIARLIPGSELMLALDFDASHSTATDPKLGQYRIIHFATHGLLNSLHPELSGIVLSLVDERGQPQNGFLRLNEIYGMKLPVDMVVLSACQTALGKEIKGEGLVGLTRGFMYAGAARVVASLWKVDDSASAELMKRFYEEMFGSQHLRPAAALRAAQIAVWKQRQTERPYYWAAFVLQGEWR